MRLLLRIENPKYVALYSQKVLRAKIRDDPMRLLTTLKEQINVTSTYYKSVGFKGLHSLTDIDLLEFA